MLSLTEKLTLKLHLFLLMFRNLVKTPLSLIWLTLPGANNTPFWTVKTALSSESGVSSCLLHERQQIRSTGVFLKWVQYETLAAHKQARDAQE